MKHTACQHTAEGEPACNECTHMIFVRPATQGNMKNDFRGFMNNVSHIDLTRCINMIEVLRAFGFKHQSEIQQAA